MKVQHEAKCVVVAGRRVALMTVLRQRWRPSPALSRHMALATAMRIRLHQCLTVILGYGPDCLLSAVTHERFRHSPNARLPSQHALHRGHRSSSSDPRRESIKKRQTEARCWDNPLSSAGLRAKPLRALPKWPNGCSSNPARRRPGGKSRSLHDPGTTEEFGVSPVHRGWQCYPSCGRNIKKSKRLIFGAWNIRTLMDRKTLTRPERRTALIAKELSRYSIDIAALSETRLADEGSVAEPKGGYTFFWKGKAQEEERIHGIGLAIKSSLLKQLPDLPSAISERLMRLRFPLSASRHVTVISAYAPTLTSSAEAKETFYEDLNNLVKAVPPGDTLLLLGDFNARVGTDYLNWKDVLGPHGVGNMNSNGLLLLSLCADNNLTITNTLFRQADKYKSTWMHPRSKQWHLIDYVICRKRDARDFRITRAMRGAECWTDHRLVRSVVKLCIAPTHWRKPKLVRPSFNIAKLNYLRHRDHFANSLDDKLTSHGPLTGSPTQKWDQFSTMVKETAQSILGQKKRVHQDWFDENDEAITQLLAEKQKAFIIWQNDISSTSKRDHLKHLQSRAKTALRHMQDEWWKRKADEVQLYADTKNSRMLFSTIKAVYGPPRPNTAPLLSTNGTLLKEKKAINERWREHFSTLLNRPSTVSNEALDQIPQRPTLDNLDLLPSLKEIQKAIKQTSLGKAPGQDGIPAEIYKTAGPVALDAFRNLLCSIWEEEDMPQEFRNAKIVSLHKNKGSKSDCGNYRGISLLSTAGKILARVILNRLISNISEVNLPESQCGFRPGRSTTDMIFVVRQLQEKCREQNLDLYAVFIDLTKAFDTVNREALWKVLYKLGCPRKFVTLIRLFHDNMTGLVLSGGEVSEPFAIANGVKQGCVLAPVLFNLFFACVLNQALGDIEDGVYIRYRLDGSLFDLRRLSAKTKTVEKLILEALFADDCALMAHTESALQLIVNKFAEASHLFGLTISLGKTEVLFQPSPSSTDLTACRPSISIKGTELKTVEEFRYLGSVISSDGSLDKEINARICKASQALGRLRVRVLNQHNIRQSTKLKLYKSVVLTSLLYGCETWTLYRRHLKLLEHFHMRSLRSIMGIKWQDRIANLEVLDRAETTSIEAMILKAQLRWTGHVIRMDSNRIPKQLLFGELCKGKRKRGRPLKRFKDCIKASIAHTGISPQAAEIFEDKRRASISEARAKKKAVALKSPGQFPCPQCGRLCRSRLGLYSHLRAHPCT
ncbi:uncharacterized protein LOC134300780 [Trichomycterus rosablanca]|uniref:uncharacterized protein LOC134300780 n=1 Tax=Trichomycterus rosablanca TaxID=2290929 RepID=UPI002F35B6FB